MTDKAPFPFLNEDWIKAQQEYWEAWSALQKQSLQGAAESAAPRNAWADALDLWWKAAASAVPAENRPFIERTLDQGKAYFQLGEEFTRFAKTVQQLSQTAGDWRELFEARFSEFKDAFSKARAEHGGLFAFSELPLDNWLRTLSSLSVMPGDFMQQVKADNLAAPFAEDLKKAVERYTSVPGIGYTREMQEHAQEGARLLHDYQDAFQDYVAAFSRLGEMTLDGLGRKLMALAESGEAITSLRQVYDLWVDAGEEAYGEFVFSEDYSRLYGRLVNALMALKFHGRTTVDELLGALNMPTRNELNTLLCRNQELRRELKSVRLQLEDGDLDKLRAELEQMRSALEQVSVARFEKELGRVRKELTQLRPPAPVEPAGKSAAPATRTRRTKAKSAAKKTTAAPRTRQR